MKERGMKKWLPFSSLVEQGKILERMIYDKYKIDKPLVFNEHTRKIDKILKEYDYKTPLNILIYYDGYLYRLKDKIVSIDINKKIVYFTSFYLPLKNIIDIDNEDLFNSIC